MIVVGVTGSLASGKSGAARIFKKLGAEVFDADLSAKRITRKGTPIHRAIVRIFGKSYLKKNGELDRQKLALRVFNHPGDLKKLNVLIHPGVIFDFLERVKKSKGKKKMWVLDVPLLFESKMETIADVTVVISAKESVILRRAEKRGYPEKLARKILGSQWPLSKKEALADFVIDNNGTVKQLEKRVKRVFNLIKGSKRVSGYAGKRVGSHSLTR